MISRRGFLQIVSQAAAGAAAGCSQSARRLSRGGSVATPNAMALAEAALEEAKRAGARYADARFSGSALHRLFLNDLRVHDDEGLETIGESSGFGVRVIVGDAWGFASDSEVTPERLRQVVQRAVEQAKAVARGPDHRPVRLAPAAPITLRRRLNGYRDPASVARGEKTAALTAINMKLLAAPGIVHANVSVTFDHEWRLLATSDGARIEDETGRAFSRIVVHAHRGRRTRSRTYTPSPRAGGFEAFDARVLLERSERAADEAVASCTAAFFDGTADLIASPSHVLMPLHQWIALPTEGDRMASPGSGVARPFLQRSDIGAFRYGSALLNVSGGPDDDPAVECDDDGVARRSFPIIREGVLVGVQTNRETAGALGLAASTGCSHGIGWRNAPLLRSSALRIERPSVSGSFEDLVADTKRGVLLDGTGTWRADADGRSAEFGADAAWEIVDGRITRMLDDVRYRTTATDVFAALDAVAGGPQALVTHPDAKGSPAQLMVHTHRAPWLRFRGIRLASASRLGL